MNGFEDFVRGLLLLVENEVITKQSAAKQVLFYCIYVLKMDPTIEPLEIAESS